MNIDELAKVHENDHPGYVLSDWYEAGIPIYTVELRTLMQVKQPMPVIEQFILRALEANVVRVKEISNMYGLDYLIIYDTLEKLQKEGYISILNFKENDDQNEVLSITKKGREILRTLEYLIPEEENFTFCQDALTGEYLPFRHLFTPKEMKKADLHLFPPKCGEPAFDDIDIITLRRVWKEVRRNLSEAYQTKDILDIIDLVNWYPGYRTIRVLHFINLENQDINIQVYDGVQRSTGHAISILEMEGQGNKVLRADKNHYLDNLENPIREVISPDLYSAIQKKAKEIPPLLQEKQRIQIQFEKARELQDANVINEDQKHLEQQLFDLQNELMRLEQRKNNLENAAPNTRILSMAEHRPMLIRALKNAKNRVFVISPWLSPNAVNREFRNVIKETIARAQIVEEKVRQFPKHYREKQCLQTLEELKKFKGGKNLYLHRLEDSHAKVVICDELFMITTSFNWLSFGGDPDRGNRIEFGILTEDRKAIRDMISRMIRVYKIPLEY